MQPAQPGFRPPQDLHQLLRHERGLCGLERFHLRLRPARTLPQYFACHAPSDLHLPVGRNKRFGDRGCLRLLGLWRNLGGNSDWGTKAWRGASESAARCLLLSINGNPAFGHRPKNQTRMKAGQGRFMAVLGQCGVIPTCRGKATTWARAGREEGEGGLRIQT